jgi:hypothetical protein
MVYSPRPGKVEWLTGSSLGTRASSIKEALRRSLRVDATALLEQSKVLEIALASESCAIENASQDSRPLGC